MIRRLQIILLGLILVTATGCKDKVLMYNCECATMADIPIDVEWQLSGVEPQNVTVLFYDQATGKLAYKHQYAHNNSAVQSHTYLAQGLYTAVVFNELMGQIDFVDVRGEDEFSTLAFYSCENSRATNRSKSIDYTHQPGDLATAIVRDIEITHEMLVYSSHHGVVNTETAPMVTKLLKVIPTRQTVYLDIKAHVKGLNNARMPARVDLRNVAESYLVAENTNSTTATTVQFDMNNREYDETRTDGTISTRIALFGPLGERLSTLCYTPECRLELDMLFMLVNKEKDLVSRNVDVTNLVKFTNNGTRGIDMTLDVDAGEELPRVKPEGSSDSGFGAEVGDWGMVDVPMDF